MHSLSLQIILTASMPLCEIERITTTITIVFGFFHH